MVILELIHAYQPDFTEGSLLLDTELTQVLLDLSWFIVIDRIAHWRRLVNQVSDLSAFDGRVLAYRQKLIGQKLDW
jgi:hypothetical protein